MARVRHGGRRGPAPFERGHKRGAARLLAFFALAVTFIATPFFLARSIIYLEPQQGLALLGLLAIAVLVALPLGERAVNTRFIVWSLALYLGLDILWADYVAVDLPFLPFVTPVRIVLFVLVGIWLFLAATSRAVHERLWKSLKVVPVISLSLLTVFLFEAVASVLSFDPGGSQKIFINHISAYFIPFLIAASFVRSRGDVEILVRTVVYCAGLVGLVVVAETILHRNLYIGFFGKYINYDASWLYGLFFGAERGGKYRAFGSFAQYLSLADFMILAMPFVIYCIERAKGAWMRLTLWGILLLSFYSIYATDSRTSLLAALCIIAVYLTFRGLRFLSRNERSVMRPIVTLVLLCIVISAPVGIAVVFSRLGWQDAFGETGTRTAQIIMGVPKVAHSPIFGYGIGNAGLVLGYRSGGELTIDNYYLSEALDAGLPAMLGFALLPLSMVFIGLGRARRDTADAPLFLAFALSGLGFGLVRVTLSQYENINFFHIILGAFVALLLLVKEESAPAPDAEAAGSRRRRRIVGDDRWFGHGAFGSSVRRPE